MNCLTTTILVYTKNGKKGKKMSILQNLRKNISETKEAETHMRLKNESLQDLWIKRQEIVEQMNIAKKKAIRETEKPFLEELKMLDTEYATIIALTI